MPTRILLATALGLFSLPVPASECPGFDKLGTFTTIPEGFQGPTPLTDVPGTHAYSSGVECTIMVDERGILIGSARIKKASCSALESQTTARFGPHTARTERQDHSLIWNIKENRFIEIITLTEGSGCSYMVTTKDPTPTPDEVAVQPVEVSTPATETKDFAWMVDGTPANGERLVGAVMDLYAGAPGPICYLQDQQQAIAEAKAAFEAQPDTQGTVAASKRKKGITIATADPLASPGSKREISGSTFELCPQ
jgi:hypothetical protein